MRFRGGETREEFLARVGKKYPKPGGCSGCPLHAIGAGFARTDGTGRNGILLVGEALGETEANLGLPFKGQAGSMLNSILHRIGHKRNDYLIANTINCQPPNNYLDGAPYELQAIEHCSPYLDETIKANPQIKVIVPMGATALHRILGASSIYSFHGTRHWSSRYERWVVPTYHPSYIMQGHFGEVLTVINDFNAAFDVRDNGYTEPTYDFIMDGRWPEPIYLEACRRFVAEYEKALWADPDIWLSVDIETPFSADIDEEEKDGKDSSWTIERISFSFRENHAITMPWQGPYIGLALRLLGGFGPKIFWNGNKFDVPRLRMHGQIGGTLIDGMDLFHFLYSDLPRGLGYAAPFFTKHKPWKHLAGSNMPFYSCMDALGALDISRGCQQRLQRDKLWDVFVRDFVRIEPTFQQLTATGVGIDTVVKERLKEHYIGLRDHSEQKIQGLVPEDVKPFIKKGGYKGKPKEVREFKRDNPELSEAACWAYFGYDKFQQADGSVVYNKRGDFNPNSSEQIKDYLRWKYGLEAVPKNKKTGKDTTGNEEIERLAKKYNDEVLYTIIDASSASDKLSSFIDNWPIAADGRVHPTFTNNPATFRLSSIRPNSQNFPNRSAELNLLREMLIGGNSAEDGWWIVEADYSGIEAIEVGHYAHDDDYIRLAKKGIHSYVAGVKLGLDINPKWDEAQLDAALKEAKKLAKRTECYPGGPAVYDAVKRGIHGSNYLMGKKLLHDTYPDLFPDQAAAGEFQRFYFSLCKPVPVWQQGTIDRVYSTCCTINDFGYRRWFWDAKKWAWSDRLGEWELVNGGDAKKIVATLPQGSAAAIIRRAMLSEAFQTIVREGKAMIQIHDSLVCRAQYSEIDRIVELLRDAMVYPIPEQGGLVIPIEVKVGKNWRSAHAKHEAGCGLTCGLNPHGMKEVASFH